MNTLQAATAIDISVIRQVNHWLQAANRLMVQEDWASGNAWHGIDHEMGVLLKDYLRRSVEDVVSFGTALKGRCGADGPCQDVAAAERELLEFREKYLRCEQTVHFFAVAINSRTTSRMAALLRACDILCVRSMREILVPLGKPSPIVLTYIDKGVGASILKAGLPLWDGYKSPLAAIKVTQHNLLRPTAIIHETGHQVAHILNWNQELSAALGHGFKGKPEMVAAAFAGWASEIAADAFAFVHTGYAAVASLHDVVCGDAYSVFAFRPNDPHPISYIRVLLNIEMCRRCFGKGPWDDLAEAFKSIYNLDKAEMAESLLIRACVDVLPEAVEIILLTAYRAFGGRSLAQVIEPARVSPRALEKLEYIAGPSLFTSHAWIWKEGIRLLAINGYKIALGVGDLQALYRQQQEWMEQLGFSIELN